MKSHNIVDSHEHGSFLESGSTGTMCSFHTLLCTHSVACFGFIHFSQEPLHTGLYDISRWNYLSKKYYAPSEVTDIEKFL